MKIRNKRELQKYSTNHFPDIDWTKIYKKCTVKTCSFIQHPPSNNPSLLGNSFGKNIW